MAHARPHHTADDSFELSAGEVIEPVCPTRNSLANKVLAVDAAAHRWYRFVLSFPPHLVRQYIERLAVPQGGVVLDPFCGTGTTVVECKKLGIPSVGLEALPMAHFASVVKTDWTPDPEGLVRHAKSVGVKAEEDLARDDIQDIRLFVEQRLPEHARVLPPEAHALLLKDSISPLPLHKTLVLLQAIEDLSDHRYRDHERLALARSLIDHIGNVRFGPEVGVTKPKEDAAVIGPWLSAIREMAEDLAGLPGRGGLSSRVHLADSRCVGELVEPGSVAAVITSPPYPNEKDYTRTTRLESVILGFIRSKAELRQLKKGLVRSNTRSVYKEDADDAWISENEDVLHLAETIEARRIKLGKTSGFERMYPRVAKLYFGGMARHLASLKTVLRPGAKLAYVVGDQASYLRVMIRTGQVLADIATSLGYEVVDIELFRSRPATATGEQLREEVVLLRWPGRQP
ncbi:MAG TPA: DNA methyltransferase [Candidatus Hydrogenedentes bacterium]|nr:DNA methyltransferase [Candidatus Hydrogenedentota bacterium]HPG68485.1 DNA methyltransferase [Candidatus Hydrogenedentota bacterium]